MTSITCFSPKTYAYVTICFTAIIGIALVNLLFSNEVNSISSKNGDETSIVRIPLSSAIIDANTDPNITIVSPLTGNSSSQNSVNEMWNSIWDKAQLEAPMGNDILNNLKTFHTQTQRNATEDLPFETLDVSKINIQQTFSIFPEPKHRNTIQIFNLKAYEELVESFTKKELNICINGGSPSAGGGGIRWKNRYSYLLKSSLQSIDALFEGVAISNRAHGNRHSLHSALFAPNFLPPKVNLLIWEFSINDYPYSSSISQEGKALQTRSILLAWLREVERIYSEDYNTRPPRVVLVYLWKAPFQLNENGQIYNPVFDYHSDFHSQITGRFDFVLGQVNFASYINELDMSYDDAKQLFLVDQLHPNGFGHLTISFLILNLLRGQGKWVGASNNKDDDVVSMKKVHEDIKIEVERYNWCCGDETTDKQILQNAVMHQVGDGSYSGWRSPLGTMTLEQPGNTYIKFGSRQLVPYFSGEITTLGKQDPLRRDRQRSVDVPCCSANGHNNTYFSVDVPTKKAMPLQDVQAIFLGFGGKVSNVSELKVYINVDESPVDGKLIQVPHDWSCFWSWMDVYHSMWFALSDKKEDVSRLSFCVENDQCAMDETSSAMLISLAVY